MHGDDVNENLFQNCKIHGSCVRGVCPRPGNIVKWLTGPRDHIIVKMYKIIESLLLSIQSRGDKLNALLRYS